jgi:hypothetical protein
LFLKRRREESGKPFALRINPRPRAAGLLRMFRDVSWRHSLSRDAASQRRQQAVLRRALQFAGSGRQQAIAAIAAGIQQFAIAMRRGKRSGEPVA